MLDPLQFKVLDCYLNRVNWVINKVVKINKDQSQDLLKKIPDRIVKGFSELKVGQDEDVKQVSEEMVNEEYKHGAEVSEELDRGIDIWEYFADTNVFKLKLVNAVIIHDSMSQNRLNGRSFRAYKDILPKIGRNSKCVITQQEDIKIPANHLHFELWNLSVFTKFSKNFETTVWISDAFLYDYVLNQWKVPSLYEMNKEKQSNTPCAFIPKMSAKDMKRKSQIEMITKSSMRRSSIRSIRQYSDMKASRQANDDETESFKSFAIDIDGDDASEKSSIFRESMFMDAYGNQDDSELWSINLKEQHFSVIPILVLKSNQESTENGISKAIQNFFEVNNDVIGDFLWKEDKDEKRSGALNEKEIRLNDSDDEFEESINLENNNYAIKIEIFQKSKQNNGLPNIQIDAKICEINLQITPFTIENICYLLNPIEYFYSSSLDEDLENFKLFVEDTLNSNLVVEPSLQPTQSPENIK